MASPIPRWHDRIPLSFKKVPRYLFDTKMTSNKAHRHLFSLTLSAVAAALGVALAHLPRMISGDDAARIDFAILPILFLAVWLPPIYTGAAYMLTDVVGCFLNGYAPFLPITLVKLAFGLLMGLFLYRRPVKPLRGAFVFTSLGVLIDFLLMLPVMRLYYYVFAPMSENAAWSVITVSRAITFPINILLRTVIYCLLVPLVTHATRRILVRNGLLPKEESK